MVASIENFYAIYGTPHEPFQIQTSGVVTLLTSMNILPIHVSHICMYKNERACPEYMYLKAYNMLHSEYGCNT